MLFVRDGFTLRCSSCVVKHPWSRGETQTRGLCPPFLFPIIYLTSRNRVFAMCVICSRQPLYDPVPTLFFPPYFLVTFRTHHAEHVDCCVDFGRDDRVHRNKFYFTAPCISIRVPASRRSGPAPAATTTPLRPT